MQVCLREHPDPALIGAAHFERVRAGLDAVGVAYTEAPLLVRGLDYYRRTTFEFAATALDAAQNAIGGGGRYDGLAEDLGGPPTDGIGFARGVDRILLACDAERVFDAPAPGHRARSRPGPRGAAAARGRSRRRGRLRAGSRGRRGRGTRSRPAR